MVIKQRIAGIAGLAAIALNLWAMPSFAQDPFRTTNPRAIGDRTEAAFRAMFERGNYPEAKKYLQDLEPNEPMGYAMRASMAYMEQDWDNLKSNATQTRETAERLVATDPLRGNLYLAVGHFLEGAHTLLREGTIKGTPKALSKLQQVFKHLNAAEKIAPNDPELNILRGYMDLMLAVNLPFSNPAQAVDRLDKHAGPRHLAYRGIALGYRDLNQHAKALEFVDRALQMAPTNPDLLYLKAQILTRQGKDRESLAFFNQALTKHKQLPNAVSSQIFFEQCATEGRLVSENRVQTCWERYLKP